jgi:hypothetical protein
MFQTLDQLKGAVDLTQLRERFAGHSKDLAAAFDDMAANLITRRTLCTRPANSRRALACNALSLPVGHLHARIAPYTLRIAND